MTEVHSCSLQSNTPLCAPVLYVLDGLKSCFQDLTMMREHTLVFDDMLSHPWSRALASHAGTVVLCHVGTEFSPTLHQ